MAEVGSGAGFAFVYLPFLSRIGGGFWIGIMQGAGQKKPKLQGGNECCYQGMRGDQNFPSWWAPVVDVGCNVSEEKGICLRGS